MAEAKLRKAIITTPYPTARDLAAFLGVPEEHVIRIAAELMDTQQTGGRGKPGLRRDTRGAEGATRKGRPRTTKKRA